MAEPPRPNKDIYEENNFGRKQDQITPNPASRVFFWLGQFLDRPATWFRETIVLPNRKNPPYYHQEFRRVPTIDECYTDDIACQFEANEQYKRDRKVETMIVEILRNRFTECVFYHGHDEAKKCQPLLDEYNEYTTNWFIKYGDLSMYNSCVEAYMKQKHRMIWERRQAERAEREANSHWICFWYTSDPKY